MSNSKYISVSCDLIDQIEINATQKSLINIKYKSEDKILIIQTRIKTWETKNKEEFLITESNQIIRLDRILELGDYTPKPFC